MNQRAPIRPSLWYCLLGVPFLLGGIAYFVYALFAGIGQIGDSLTQVVVPGRAQLTLRGGATYTVFLEDRSVVRGTIYTTQQPVSGLACRLASIPGGTPVSLEKPGMNLTYDFGERSGRSILQFFIQNDGDYAFACDYGDRPQGPETVVAVGAGVGTGLFRTVLESLVALLAGGALFTMVIVAVVILRDRARKRAQAGELAPS